MIRCPRNLAADRLGHDIAHSLKVHGNHHVHPGGTDVELEAVRHHDHAGRIGVRLVRQVNEQLDGGHFLEGRQNDEAVGHHPSPGHLHHGNEILRSADHRHGGRAVGRKRDLSSDVGVGEDDPLDHPRRGVVDHGDLVAA